MLHPGTDSLLAQSFGGGPGSIRASEKESTPPAPENYQVISGVKVYFDSNISGSFSTHVSGN